MKYKIYEMVAPEQLSYVNNTDYYPKTMNRFVIEEISCNVIWDNEFNSVTDAEKAIIENKDKLKFLKLTVLPVISIGYEGNVE